MTPLNHEPSNGERTLRVDRIVAGGIGLARRADGCVVFVPRTAPGDVVAVEFTEIRRRWSRARVSRLISPGTARRDPPCEYYDRCGGCQLQHLRYDAQLEVKGTIVLDCLRRQGGVEWPEIDVDPSPKQLAYRNRVSFTVRRAGGALMAGFHGLDDPDSVVDVSHCPLAEPPINAAWRALRDRLEELFRPARRDVRLTLRATADGQVGLVVEGERGARSALKGLAAVAELDVVWWIDRKRVLTGGSRSRLLAERWNRYEVPLPGNAFLQVNREAAMKMDEHVRCRCGGSPNRSVIDAYCGIGLRALELARDGARVTAVDIDGPSVEVASRLAAEHGATVRFVAATVESVLETLLPADVVILNPPRRGVAPTVVDTLNRQPPERIVYISCDPATLARDLKALRDRFRLAEVRAFDLFPQTAHVETVATLVRSG